MQVMTHRKRALTPGVISKIYAKFGLNLSLNVVFIQVLIHNKVYVFFTYWAMSKTLLGGHFEIQDGRI
jgi:hypothetical protein